MDSACVCLLRREPLPLTAADGETFARLVKRSFSQRRKMMLKLLRADWPAERLDAGFARVKLSPQARAEEASREQFIRLAQWLSTDSGP